MEYDREVVNSLTSLDPCQITKIVRFGCVVD